MLPKFLSSFFLKALPLRANLQDAVNQLKPRDVADACSYAVSVLDSCTSATPKFDKLATSDQASCLCYSSDSWIPESLDNAVETCADFALTADPSDYALIAPMEAFCTLAGDVMGKGPAAAPASTTPSARTGSLSAESAGITAPPSTARQTATLNVNSDCSFFSWALDYCNSVSPGFSDFDLTSQAPCLCYSSTSWYPDLVDDAISGCADYVKTASPSAYSIFTSIEGYCESIGDVFSTDDDSATNYGLAFPKSTPTNAVATSTGPAVVTKTAGPAVATAKATTAGGGPRLSSGAPGQWQTSWISAFASLFIFLFVNAAAMNDFA